MSLATKSCSVCHAGAETLSPPHIEEYLRDVAGWELVVLGESPAILRKYKFKNFAQSLALVNKIGELAEKEGHHPDLKFGWGYVEVTLYSHAAGGLTENDFILAAKINELT